MRNLIKTAGTAKVSKMTFAETHEMVGNSAQAKSNRRWFPEQAALVDKINSGEITDAEAFKLEKEG